MSVLYALPGVLLALCAVCAEATSFLVTRNSSTTGHMTPQELERGLGAAMGEALGCGGVIGQEQLLRIEEQLAPTWRTLPKNSEGNVERRSLRYAIHRYFNRQSAIHIRGFEPSRPPNASGWGSGDILGQRVPAYVESVLESEHKLARGFTLSDAAQMVSTIQQLIFDWEGNLLEQVWSEQGRPLSRSLQGEDDLLRLLEAYTIYWLLGADADGVVALLSDALLLEATVPHWAQVSDFLRGEVRALEHRRAIEPAQAFRDGSAREGHNALSSRFSFEDAHGIIGGIRQNFAGFWDSECSSMKASLFEMDAHRVGRVPLSTFYGTGMEADWRFGESEAYLRELGALDESSWRGKQVVISNYMQAASNCVISTPHYLVCCINDCEPLFHEIEVAIGTPTAEPKRLLGVISSMAAQSTLDDDFPPPLSGTLARQLEQIAAAHSGEVPLHGRLFAQWLHYAFPRECAFPHKAGVAASITPSEYGADFYASREEMRKHMSANASNQSTAGQDDVQWMSQWSPEEELIAEHAIGIPAPWEQRGCAFGAMALIGGMMPVAILASLGAVRRAHAASNGGVPGLPSSKQHYV